MPAHPDLVAHSQNFAKGRHSLGAGIHGFVGYAASNVYVIEGTDELVLIDTTESTAAQRLGGIADRDKQC